VSGATEAFAPEAGASPIAGRCGHTLVLAVMYRYTLAAHVAWSSPGLRLQPPEGTIEYQMQRALAPLARTGGGPPTESSLEKVREYAAVPERASRMPAG
jgi:hypothetical protein